MTIKHLLTTVSFLAGILVVALITKNIILNGTPELVLQTAPPLASTISQSLITPQSKGVLPIAGKNFNIKSANYFDNNQWAVVFVSSIPDNNNAALVLEKLNGSYQVILGPGTTFSATNVQTMPNDVVTYLTKQGLVSSATYSQ